MDVSQVAVASIEDPSLLFFVEVIVVNKNGKERMTGKIVVMQTRNY